VAIAGSTRGSEIRPIPVRSLIAKVEVEIPSLATAPGIALVIVAFVITVVAAVVSRSARAIVILIFVAIALQ
jgi:hypothetical protein